MTTFVITEQTTRECNACCCEAVGGSPGEIDRWILDYAPWAVPIGGKGISEIVANVEQIHAPSVANKPTAGNASAVTPFNTPLEGQLSTHVTNPGAETLAYARIAFYGPHNGTVTIDPVTGDFSYVPRNGFTGYDKFYYEITAASGAKSIAQFIVGVSPATGSLPAVPAFDPPVAIPDSRIMLDKAFYRGTLAVVISPAAQIGAIYRVTVQATALDCDCNPFVNKSCYDLAIGKC